MIEPTQAEAIETRRRRDILKSLLEREYEALEDTGEEIYSENANLYERWIAEINGCNVPNPRPTTPRRGDTMTGRYPLDTTTDYHNQRLDYDPSADRILRPISPLNITRESVKNEGRIAAQKPGSRLYDIPYPPEDPRRAVFMEGFNEEKERIAKAMKEGH